MVIDPFIDGHVHTRYCRHAVGEMEEYVLAAVDKGLSQLIFLEHLEKGICYDGQTWLEADDFAAYFAEGRGLAAKYRDVIAVRLGIEVGYNPQCVADIRRQVARLQGERIGISYHFVELNGRHYNLLSRRSGNRSALVGLGPERVARMYFERLREAVHVLDGDVVCHLDAALRHYPQYELGERDLALIEDILAVIKQKGMAIEVNTSGYQFRPEPFPTRIILQRAAALGIPMVAGSDAHRPSEVGRYFERLAHVLTGDGFVK